MNVKVEKLTNLELNWAIEELEDIIKHGKELFEMISNSDEELTLWFDEMMKLSATHKTPKSTDDFKLLLKESIDKFEKTLDDIQKEYRRRLM